MVWARWFDDPQRATGPGSTEKGKVKFDEPDVIFGSGHWAIAK